MAGLVQGTTVALRAKSSMATAGMGNSLISTLELIGAIIIALLAIIVPTICLALIVLLFVFVFRKMGKLIFRRTQTGSGQRPVV
jgi:hypothetical protein